MAKMSLSLGATVERDDNGKQSVRFVKSEIRIDEVDLEQDLDSQLLKFKEAHDKVFSALAAELGKKLNIRKKG